MHVCKCSTWWCHLTQIRPCWKLLFPLQTLYQSRNPSDCWKPEFDQMMLWNQMLEGCRRQADCQTPERSRNHLWNKNNVLSFPCCQQRTVLVGPWSKWGPDILGSYCPNKHPFKLKWLESHQQGSLEENNRNTPTLEPKSQEEKRQRKKRRTEITARPATVNYWSG